MTAATTTTTNNNNNNINNNRYDLESMLGALRTSQSQNQLAVFEPAAGQSTQALKDQWASLEAREVAYDAALQACIVAYVCYGLFVLSCRQHNNSAVLTRTKNRQRRRMDVR